MLWQAANKQRQAVTYYSLMLEFEYMLAFHCEACEAYQDHWQKTARRKHQETVRRKLATSRVTQGNLVESCGPRLRGQLQCQPTDSGRRALCEAFTTCFCRRVKNRTCSRAHFRKLGRGGVGWGGDNSNPVYGYATRSSLALHATLQDLHLHFMLRYKIFTCTSCYATWSSLALHATLHDLYLHFILRYKIFTCTSCYATWSSLAIHATLHDLHLHFMLRYMIFTCTSCYATRSWLALHATLYDFHLHSMLRYKIFTCTSCYATWSSLGLHATLHDLHLHFMLRYKIYRKKKSCRSICFCG